jgi:hypothetical protein
VIRNGKCPGQVRHPLETGARIRQAANSRALASASRDGPCCTAWAIAHAALGSPPSSTTPPAGLPHPLPGRPAALHARPTDGTAISPRRPNPPSCGMAPRTVPPPCSAPSNHHRGNINVQALQYGTVSFQLHASRTFCHRLFDCRIIRRFPAVMWTFTITSIIRLLLSLCFEHRHEFRQFLQLCGCAPGCVARYTWCSRSNERTKLQGLDWRKIRPR